MVLGLWSWVPHRRWPLEWRNRCAASSLVACRWRSPIAGMDYSRMFHQGSRLAVVLGETIDCSGELTVWHYTSRGTRFLKREYQWTQDDWILLRLRWWRRWMRASLRIFPIPRSRIAMMNWTIKRNKDCYVTSHEVFLKSRRNWSLKNGCPKQNYNKNNTFLYLYIGILGLIFLFFLYNRI